MINAMEISNLKNLLLTMKPMFEKDKEIPVILRLYEIDYILSKIAIDQDKLKEMTK